ncbi:MAG: coproporphyrinogen dehydrogenase HemZ [Clostridia bacterium]|nr:coproporphyrinogen dehydrogenase HemZ [Clostridia bacterium]
MRLKIHGNINEYYAQTLCLLFFPGSKFSVKNEPEKDEPGAEITVVEDEENVTVSVTLTHLGNTTNAIAIEPKSKYARGEKCTNIACGKAFFEAGKNLRGVRPQWGILTGIRPSKFIIDLMNEGNSRADAVKILKQDYLVNPKKANIAAEIAEGEQRIMAGMKKNSCSLYVSIPFCPSRCHYCSFVSCSSPKLLSLIDDYLEKLCFDIRETVDVIHSLGLTVSTVYIGGGTPTTLSEAQLHKLFSAIAEKLNVAELEEFTLEAGRPDTITAGKLHEAAEAGVTRVSINTQTFNDDVLENIGRKHTSGDFYRAFELAKNSGIPHINTDLIAGLPGEGFLSFSCSVDRLVELRPDNITVHTLCIKNAADFSKIKSEIYRKNVRDVTKCIDYSQIAAKNAGYAPYYIYRQKNSVGNLENVGFALPGTEGKYNVYMMDEIQTIFAVGAGAVSKLVSLEKSQIKRIFEYKYPYEYLSDTVGQKRREKLEAIEKFYSEIRGEK